MEGQGQQVLNWKENILSQISIREESLSTNKHLYEKLTDLSEKLVKEVKRRREVENELKIVSSNRAYHPRSDKESHRLSSDSTAFYQKRISDLESQVVTLKDERSELYKNQGQNAQRLLDMTEKVKQQEEQLKTYNEEIQNLRSKMKRLNERTESSVEAVKEKDKAIQILQDELTTSHLELTKIEERLKQLKIENNSLLQRWLKKMNEEAESMNLSNLLNGASGPVDAASSMSNLRIHGTKLLNMSVTSPISTPPPIEKKERPVVSIPDSVNIKIQPHSSEINSVQFSTEGSLFASGSTDKNVNVYNSANGKLLQTFTGSLQSVMHVEFNNSDEFLLGASNDNSVRIWNLQTGKLKDTLTGHIGKIYSAKFTLDSTKILSGSHDRTLKLWDLHRSICTRTIFTFSSCNDVCIIDPDATNVASCHLDHSIRVWDMKSSNCIKELSGIHFGQITSLSVSPDGTKLLSNSRDNTLKLFDLRTYEPIFTLEAEGYRVPMNWSKACFSPDGRFASAGSTDGSIFHWDVSTGQFEISHTQHSYPICSIGWSNQGHQLVSVDKERNIFLWEDSKRKIKVEQDYYS